MPNWTTEQKQAIYEKNTNLLIAAAAGSGKTAVLVERIINKIINENVDIDKLLVVTFTNAAASEMRERVLSAIYKKLEEDPENENLLRQITLLNMASICTIDSFCLDVVKNNFYELENISPNFRIADTPEIELLKQEILDELFEKKYIEEDKDFTKLINTYTSYRDDTPLKDLILKIHNYINSSPYPKKWLEEKIEMFNIGNELEKDFSQTPWGKILLEELNDELIDDISILKDMIESLNNDKELEEFRQTIETDVKQLETLKQNLNSWENSYQIAQNIKFTNWPRKRIESEIKEEAKKARDNVKKKYNTKVSKILISDSEQSNKDIYDMYDILKKLENLILEFDQIFSKKKRDKNIVDFSDIEHFALQILENQEIARKYIDKFEEIAIDEYQDSNLVQEKILTSISRGNNIFMVGDVKQSIYRFRQAMPKLFIDKYNTFSLVKDHKESTEQIEENKNGRKIQLYKNFRSRNLVLDFTNLIFKNIMSQDLGDVEYIESEYLNFGAEDYKNIKQSLKTEIDIIDVKNEEEQELNEENTEDYDNTENEELEHIENIELEARYVAQKINKLIKSKYQIYDRKKEAFRDITYKDIAILLRSTKDKANIYEQELINLGIPVFSDSTQEYLDSIEIQTIMSLLKIIDNPIQDIPLVTVLRSNIGGFTDNELVEIRLSDKYDDFYNCMLKAQIDVSKQLKEKIQKFLDNLEKWRKEQEYLSLDELIWKIYSDTGYYNYVGLMPNGNLRQANLKMLFERAKKYETASFKGLYNFINFIEKLRINSGDLSSAKIIGENDNVVRIMSIHKSKGLEFPIVFLVNSNKQFNEQDIKKDNVLMHQEIGIGAKYIDYNAQVQYDTLTREAVKNVIKNENISEEMRVLYVALTRAKEKIIITGVSKDFEKQIEDIEKQENIYSRKNGKINPILVKKYKSYLDWILLVYLYEKNNSENLLEVNRIKPKEIMTSKEIQEQENQSEHIKQVLDNIQISKNEIDKIKDILEYEYTHKISTMIPTKSSVTKIKQLKQEQVGIHNSVMLENVEDIQNLENVKRNKTQEITFEKPKFLQEVKEEKITSAEKGTLIHLCLQKLNPKEDYSLQKINELIESLQLKQIITEKEAEAINPYKILEFTKSNIWKSLQSAKEIYQEKPFYINVPAKDIYDENVDDTILVQGIIDLFFIDKDDNLVLVDYKNDFVESNNEAILINKYSSQLALYKQALEQSLNRCVNKVLIYSVFLAKEVEI